MSAERLVSDLGDAPEGRGPVLLFDGACHLCDGTVQWLLAHDHRRTLRFASLQSDAARRVLADRAAAPLPDSLVLVDDAGVHVRSDAVLRIAGHLGPPWSWWRVAGMFPQSLRDQVYAWVAVNRYRWFGRRDVCVMPSLELHDRFLDADEPPRLPVEPSKLDTAEAPGHRSFWRAWHSRLVPTFLVLTAVPPTFEFVPGGEELTLMIYRGYAWVMAPLAQAWLGRAVAFVPNGSGDQTASYLTVVLNIGLTLLLAGVWARAARSSPIGERAVGAVRVYVRYFLAGMMFLYGWVKIFGMQMPAPGPERLLVSIGDTSPMGLLWTLMGASSLYQAFGGFTEALCGLLLCWRRTSLLGALLTAGVMTNVVMLNMSYDVPVKIFSVTLWLMAVWLMAPHIPRLAALLLLNLPAPPAPSAPAPAPHPSWSGTLRRFAPALLTTALIAGSLVPTLQMRNAMAQAQREAQLEGLYVVESIEGQELIDFAGDDGTPWTRVGVSERVPGGGSATVQRRSGASRGFGLRIDHTARTLSFRRMASDPATSTRFSYERPTPDTLLLTAQATALPVTIRLRRIPQQSLLMERGFHWVNESPYNR